MTQYIDKAALVAEIERRIKGLNACHADRVAGYAGEISGLERLLSFLNTLEVKDDMDTIHPVDDVVSNDTIANSLEISRHGNSHNGETLEEAAKNHKSAIHIVSPQWTSEVENAFKAGAKWQKKQTIDKVCEWLEDNVDHYAYNKDFVPNAKERFIKMFRLAEI